jgi:hypothetical protein
MTNAIKVLLQMQSGFLHLELTLLWRTIHLGRPVIGLTSKCEAGIMFN